MELAKVAGIEAGDQPFYAVFVMKAGAKPLKQKKGQPDYEHLKTQVYWYLAEAINSGSIRIHDKAMQEEITDECMQIKTINRDKMEDKVKMIKKDEVIPMIRKWAIGLRFRTIIKYVIDWTNN